MRTLLLAAVLAPLVLAGCTSTLGSDPATLEGRALAFEHLEGCFSRQGTELHRVLATQAEWEQLWRQACGDGSVLPVMAADGAATSPAPSVDFRTSVVVATFGGEHRTGGYEHRVVNVTAFSDRVRVDVERVRPGPQCGTTDALTYPHDLVVAERFEAPARFVFRDLVRAC